MNLSQPAVSKMLKEIESLFGFDILSDNHEAWIRNRR